MGQARQACLGMPLCMFGTDIVGIIYLISEGKNESHGSDVWVLSDSMWLNNVTIAFVMIIMQKSVQMCHTVDLVLII